MYIAVASSGQTEIASVTVGPLVGSAAGFRSASGRLNHSVYGSGCITPVTQHFHRLNRFMAFRLSLPQRLSFVAFSSLVPLTTLVDLTLTIQSAQALSSQALSSNALSPSSRVISQSNPKADAPVPIAPEVPLKDEVRSPLQDRIDRLRRDTQRPVAPVQGAPLPTPIAPLPDYRRSGLPSTNVPSPPRAVRRDQRYRLGPGDQVSIIVQRFSDLNVQGQVSPEGTLALPLVGTLSVQGLTVPEAQELVRRSYDRFVVNPIVAMTLVAQRPVQVTVIGKVVRPGFYPLQSARVADALLVAGGSLPGGDLRSVQVRHTMPNGSTQVEVVDLYSPLALGAPMPTLRLEDGDTLYVPELRDTTNYDSALIAKTTLLTLRPVQVTVIGQVGRPGFYGLNTGRVTEGLQVAGGVLAGADLRQVTIRRRALDGSLLDQVVDLYGPLTQGSGLPTLQLEDNDTIVVPELTDLKDYDQTLVAKSAIAKPTITVRIISYATGTTGVLTLPSSSGFRDALNGLPLNNADFKKVALVRYDPKTGKALTRTFDARHVLIGYEGQNVPLMDNDVVVVGRNLVTKITNVLGTFTQPFRDVIGFFSFFDSLRTTASNLFKPLN
jgi:polysaccharide biosynthesis/export protein